MREIYKIDERLLGIEGIKMGNRGFDIEFKDTPYKKGVFYYRSITGTYCRFEDKFPEFSYEDAVDYLINVVNKSTNPEKLIGNLNISYYDLDTLKVVTTDPDEIRQIKGDFKVLQKGRKICK